MTERNMIVFVCEHGAAKSVLAAAQFNRLAGEKGRHLRAVARGTNPDAELSESTVHGLAQDGLVPTEPIPRKLSVEEVRSAKRVIRFCELTPEYLENELIEAWKDIPAVSENYDKARDAIVIRIHQLLNNIRSSP